MEANFNLLGLLPSAANVVAESHMLASPILVPEFRSSLLSRRVGLLPKAHTAYKDTIGDSIWNFPTKIFDL
ncbi:hypothetical protein CYANOKiyG1_34180 [Okeania sp. KiyG1]|nr:hypothetical protein CYANOKiyG1_34180 [Okeania sp. KiyG1]